MKPALFTYPYIASYSTMMLLGFVAGWWLARRRAPLFGIARQHLDNLGLLLPMAGLFGARFFARLFYAKVSLIEALKFWKGDGLVFYGGFLSCIGMILVYGAARRLNLAKLCDCLAPSAALGLAFGRVGCFLGGCCWGDLCVDRSALAKIPVNVVRQIQTVPAISRPGWFAAVRFPPASEPFKQQVKFGLIDANAATSLPVHPVQLYEAGLAAALTWILHRNFMRKEVSGTASLTLLSGYAAIRFLTEYLRADNKPYAFGLTISQLISLDVLLFCLFAAMIRMVVAKKSKPQRVPVSVTISAASQLHF
jgi:phosphatidylglycerol:prolipoprotein diacylglycerol transferase